MMWNRALVLAILAVMCSAANGQDRKTTLFATEAGRESGTASSTVEGELSPANPDAPGTPTTPPAPNGLAPREPIPKYSRLTKPHGDSKLIVKFTDSVKARMQADNTVRFTAGGDHQVFQQLAQHFNLTFSPSIKVSTDIINEVLERAAAHSGLAQPDLLGIMYVHTPRGVEEAVGNLLLQLDCVEFAYFETPMTPSGFGPVSGACCIASSCYNMPDADTCASLGGTFIGGDCYPDPNNPNTFACPGPAIGACCIQGVCHQTTEALCDLNFGVFTLSEHCVDFFAKVPTLRCGACCTPIGCVQALDVAECGDPASFHPNTPCYFAICAGPPRHACCLPGDVCDDGITAAECSAFGGIFKAFGPGNTPACDEAECQFDCGDPDAASCFVIHPLPYCNNAACCEAVGGIRAFCTSDFGEWDFLCVAIANSICTQVPVDRCQTPFNTDCFQEHASAGCLDAHCCYTVCAIDPACCNIAGVGWDTLCVSYAIQYCGGNVVDAPTPDFSVWQGYLRESIWDGQVGGRPPGIPLPPDPPTFIECYNGMGMALFSEGPSIAVPLRLIDDPSLPLGDPQRYMGLYGMGRELNDPPPFGYGVGQFNGARGASIKVAVIDGSYFVGHEDLNVIPEPGQTMILIPEIANPRHGTAVLGVIGALYNFDQFGNQIGMVGVAPDAEMYFFPTTSIEEGPRWQAAFLKCFTQFGPGDVVVVPFAPPPGNFNTDPQGNLLLRLARDLGIAAVVAAGNSCINLDDLPDLGDSGAIVVGGVCPGFRFCRLLNSNFYQSAPITSSNRVHTAGWGEFVATTGGSANLFLGVTGGVPDMNRSYTNSFAGTSAAAAQIGGVVACLQGLAKQFYGIPLSVNGSGPGDPNHLRRAITNTQRPQCGSPNPPGFPIDLGCGPDVDPNSPPLRVGGYPRPRIAAAAMFNTPPLAYDQSPLIREMYRIRGQILFGNLFSIKGSDNNYLVTQMQFTPRNLVPQLNSNNAEANQLAAKLKYLSTGYTTDIMLRANTTARSGAITITGEILAGDEFSMVIYEMYDWRAHRWSFVALNMLPSGPQGSEQPVEHVLSDGLRFIDRGTGNIYLRVYTLGIGNPNIGNQLGGGAAGSMLFIDWITLTVGPIFGNP